MIVVEQGSAEWHALRLGRVTASRVADVVRKTKTGVSASRMTYMGELIAERLTGAPAESYKSAAMQWGSEVEADARSNYEFMCDATVEPGGFVEHPKIKMAGASPDGLVGTEGLVELKCPLTATHIDTLLGGSVPADYIKQCQWQLACMPARKWVDWVSFDPRMPPSMRMHVERIPRDNVMIAELEAAVAKFLDDLDAKLAELRKRFAPPQNLLMAG